MSTRRGGVSRGPPKHQNSVTWTPHRGATRSEKDVGGVDGQGFAPVNGVCEKCRAVIEWKRKYGKYKPLKEPAKCQHCQKRNVKAAYHAVCSGCAAERKACPKCLKPATGIGRSLEDEEADRRKLEEALRTMRERDRRTLLRAMEKGSVKKLSKFDDDEGRDDDDSESELDKEGDDEPPKGTCTTSGSHDEKASDAGIRNQEKDAVDQNGDAKRNRIDELEKGDDTSDEESDWETDDDDETNVSMGVCKDTGGSSLQMDALVKESLSVELEKLTVASSHAT